MIAEKLDREQQAFWGAFQYLFGEIGNEPETYWSWAIGHIAHVGPSEVQWMTPEDLLRAGQFFRAKYGVGDA